MSAHGAGVCVAVSAGVLALLSASPTPADPGGPQEARTERPTYEVARAGAPIQVDGRLDEAAWQAAETFAFFNSRDGSPAPAELHTIAKALYDDEFIYFAFDSADTNAWSTRKVRDEHLWEEEVVEVFIQADPTHPSYIELEVNPLGTMIDIFLIDIRKPIPYTTWNSAGLRWAAHVNGTVDGQPGDKSWSCEMALPLVEVVTAPNIPPLPGDRWRRTCIAWSGGRPRPVWRGPRRWSGTFIDRTGSGTWSSWTGWFPDSSRLDRFAAP